MEIDDLQVAANGPIIIQQIVADADATSESIEWDIVWMLTDALSFSFTGAYTDA